ncbi:glycosyl transferase [Prolixibacter bellariivorans]|uniref:Glycosyl transferase n=1 Tax=Prolixibacter bellariivorans TaxID=314319 RepID=A0A5M4B0S0_9BACT|nr:glycosyltransferase [Prolixibacter bellariivorans]GET33759.1 glycosyl transferase [Prolixibacter bellariivorans]
MKNKKICFFVKIDDIKILDDVNFYAQDIRILKELGYEVIITNRISELFRIKYDLYFVWWWTYAIFPLIASIINRKPLIITGTFNIANPHNSYHSRSFIERILIKTPLKYSDANIFVSEYELIEMKKHFNYNNFNYIPHIVEPKYQNQTSPILPKEKFFLSVSWLQKANYKRKCIDLTIKAIALIKDQLKDYKYIIVGRYGDGIHELEKLVKDLKIENLVQFRGSVSEEEKIELMKKCSIFISPTYYEGFGLAMLEASSCGAVVLSTKNSAVPYVLDNLPVYTKENTPEEIAKSILSTISNHNIIEEKARQGIERSKELFSYSTRLNGLKNIIEKIIK